jgi:hypothetical protein
MILAVASAVGDRGPGVVSLSCHMVPSSIHESGTKIPALGVCYHCSTRTCGMRAFMDLNAGLLIGAHARPTLVGQVGCLLIQLADGLDVCVKLLGVFGAFVIEPIA